MAEEAVVVEQAATVVETPGPSPFGNNAWSEELPTVKEPEKPAAAVTATETTPVVTPTTNSDEEILDPKDWLKRVFEVDDVEVLKAERAEYKKLKENPQTASEIKFADEQSRLIHELIRDGKRKEVRQFLETQEKIETVITAQVDDKNAADIIKLNMQLQNPNLSKEDIDFQYNEEYVASKEPVQRKLEEDEDFQERHDDWKERVEKLEKKRMIAAKMAQPQIAAAKSQITLPELSRPEPQVQKPSQESLAEANKVRETFLNKLESDYAKFDGYATTVKDESVELPVSFKTPDEAKVAIKERFKAGFDINGFIDGRWSDANGNTKIEQILSDVYILENLDKVLAGVANKAAADRLTEYIKASKNINLNNGKSAQQTFDPNQNGQKSISPFSQGAWSETPVVNHN